MSTFLNDIKYGLRILAKSPVFTAVVILMGLSQKSLPQQSCLSELHRSLQSLRPSLEPTHGPTTLLDLSHGMDTARELIRIRIS